MQRIQAAAQDITAKLRLPLMQVLGVVALALFGAIGAWLGESATVWRCCVHQHASCKIYFWWHCLHHLLRTFCCPCCSSVCIFRDSI